MSDLKLQGFAARAEERMPLPDFDELENRGRRLRRRRVAAVTATTVTCVLAVVGVAVLRDDAPESVEPIRPPDDAQVQAEDYPGPVMETLDAGRYVLSPSLTDDYPKARITLPEGWNAWQGPNRFGDERDPDGDWYVGILVLKVDGVASRPCQRPGADDHLDPTAEALVRAVRAIPGFRITETAEPLETFGYPATHFRLIPEDPTATCDANLFRTGANGVVAGYADTEDVWVVDVGGYPVLVDAQRHGRTPQAIRRELAAAVDSIEFYFEDRPTNHR